MLTTNNLNVPLPKGLEEKVIDDGKGGKITILVAAEKLKSVTTKDINIGPRTGKGEPQKNYYPPLTTNDIPFPESKTARKRRMAAQKREAGKKELADKAGAMVKSK